MARLEHIQIKISTYKKYRNETRENNYSNITNIKYSFLNAQILNWFKKYFDPQN